MPIEISVPRLGWSMEEGAFVAWLKRDGELVRAGDALFSIEGDKAVQEIDAIDSGILRIAPNAPAPGAAIRVGDLLGHLLSPAEAAAGGPASVPSSPSPARSRSLAAARPEASPAPPAVPAPGSDAATAVLGPAARRRAISPRALRVAAELGIDWTTVAGGGRTGRIRERDIRGAAAAGRSGPVVARPTVPGRAMVSPGGARPRAVFFGELLMRLATRHHERFTQAREFDVRYTGAEANAAVSLVQFGLDAFVVSAVPDHELGQACLNYLRQFGVNTDHVARRGARLGTFYLETGMAPRASRVIYDRAGSAFSELRPGLFDWETILAGKQWFHWSGTAPALGPGLAGVIAEACAAARRGGLQVSCDLNYRATLWNPEQARQVMRPLMREVDVLIGNEEHIEVMLGASDGEASPGASMHAGAAADVAADMAMALRARFGFRAVAITRRDGTERAANPWRCWLANEAGAFASRGYPVAAVDRIGAGDAFSGALIWALLNGWAGPEAIEFAAAAGALKHSVPGDFNLVTCDEVLALAQGDTGQRVRR